MPLYEYKCDGCGRVFEIIQKFSDTPLVTDEVCGGAVHRLLSAPALMFKGSGFYVNDYAKGGKSPGNGGPKKSEGSGSGSEGAGSDGSRSKNSESSAKGSDSAKNSESSSNSDSGKKSDSSSSSSASESSKPAPATSSDTK